MVTTRKPQKLHPTVLVLVTDQLSCDRLILAGRALADEHQCVLEVQNIARFGNVPDPAAIEHLYRTSLNAGARMTCITVKTLNAAWCSCWRIVCPTMW